MLNLLVRFAPALENHLWQSTAFAAAAWLVTLALRKNQARARYWVWLAASLKFLLPFSLLFAIGGYLRPARVVAVASAPVSVAIQQIAQPFSEFAPVNVLTAPADAHDSNIPLALLAIWASGVFIIAFSWWRRWWRVRRVYGDARVAFVHMGVAVRASPSLLEPGVFGILHPVLMLPEGIADRLTPEQMDAILAHEMCHVRRRDNLTAALHMFVECIFWFHPLVWWIGAQMVEERERACDEEVLMRGGEAETYAEGILEVCKYYAESPVACVSGVSGADLKKRIVRIMTGQFAAKLTFGGKLLLGIVGAAAVAVPLAFGAIATPRSAMIRHVRFMLQTVGGAADASQPGQSAVAGDAVV